MQSARASFISGRHLRRQISVRYTYTLAQTQLDFSKILLIHDGFAESSTGYAITKVKFGDERACNRTDVDEHTCAMLCVK
jgi:hypothetical protein